MERVVRGRSFTLSQVFYSDGVAVTPTGTPTVAIVRSDGTTVTTSSVAGTGTGPYTVTVTAANNALLDTLIVTWTAIISGQANTYVDTVEVAGDVLFSVAQARAALGNPAYDVDSIIEARIYAETELERGLGFALVPRYERRTLQARRARQIRLRPFVRAIRAVTIGGTALSAANIDNLIFGADGWVSGYSWWNGQIIVDYEHGLDVGNDLTAGANRAALGLAVEYLGGDSGTVDPRAERLITDDGTIVYGAGATGPFGVPAVNQWVKANGMPRVA